MSRFSRFVVGVAIGFMGTAMSPAVPFSGSRPTLDSFYPVSGAPGTSVTVIGSNLSGVREVRFGAGLAVFTSVSTSRLIATVPLDATSGPISVGTAFGTAVSLGRFLVAPRITDFSPTNGSPGTVVTIEGANFADILAVQFNNKRASSFFVTAETQIHATVPAGASSGFISVLTPVGTAFSTNQFVITGTEPIISDFSPTNGPPGTIVVIEGRSFNGATAVRFNTNLAVRFSVTAPTQISATVPTNATTGPIRVTTPSGTGVSAKPFVVATTPVVVGFSPTNGPPGTLVIIDGFNFSGAIAVQFNGASAAGFSVTSPTQILVPVPTNASSGPISVSAAAGTGVSAASFLVATQPIINEFAPTNGPAGTPVIIDGINFAGATAVKFNGTNATTFSVTSPTQISATVPLGATTGPLAITTPRGTGTSSNHFVVTASQPVITDFSPTTGLPGTIVTVTGLNFSGATAVKFNGVDASFSVTAPTQLTCTVPAGAITGPISVFTAAGSGFSPARFIVVPRIANFSPLEGTAGASVIIRGTNFTDVVAVRFNGVPATFTNTSPGEITASVPLEGLSGPISITTTAGIVASTNAFVILPNLLGCSPTAGPVGTRVTLRGTHLADAISVRFNGVNAAFVPRSSTELQAIVPVGATTGPIVVVTPSGSATSPALFSVGVSADLVVTQADFTNAFVLGGNLTFSIVVTNLGPSDATSVVLTDRLPAGTLFVSGTLSQGWYQQGSGVVTCNLGNLAAGAVARLTIAVTPTAIGILTNRVSVKATEPDPASGDNLVETVTTVLPGPTTLSIRRLDENQVAISWLVSGANYVLQWAEQPSFLAVWSSVTNLPAVLGASNTVIVPVSPASRFFRLSKP